MILSLVKTYWKPLAGIALILIIFLFGWYKGYSYEKERFDAFKYEIEVNARVQEQKNALVVKNQTKVSEEITKGYANAIKNLNSHYATKWLHNNNTSSSTVSEVSNSTSTIDGETKGDLSSTIRDCSLDVVQLLYLQQWIKDQEIVNGN